MIQFSSRRVHPLSCLTLTILLCASTTLLAQLSTLHRFGKGTDGYLPGGGLVADAAGNLYGRTLGGGTFESGTIFELSPPVTSGGWIETILYNFDSTGSGCACDLVFDSAGNLYGPDGTGIFQLAPPAVPGDPWTFNVLYTFKGGPQDGRVPDGGLIFDQAGNLYGTTYYGGEEDEGTIFELSPPAAPGGTWTETVLHSFDGFYGEGPEGNLLLAGGSLYGTTSDGQHDGAVFVLVPPQVGQTKWHEKLLYNFTGGADGGSPFAGLTLRGKNLYGTTGYGGTSQLCNGRAGCGVVFELSPPSTAGGPWTEAVLYTFLNGSDGSLPGSPVTFDRSGNLYTTSRAGGGGNCDYGSDYGCGAVIELSPPSTQGGVWSETTLHTFTGSIDDEGTDVSGLVFDHSQKLYGTTGGGGYVVGHLGTVFAIVP
jgi:uncharacterized repeat protein (TIGR03803 family)